MKKNPPNGFKLYLHIGVIHTLDADMLQATLVLKSCLHQEMATQTRPNLLPPAIIIY